MKNLTKFIGIIAIVAIIGFSFAALSLTGCDNGSGSGGSGGGSGGGDKIPAKWQGKYIGVDSFATATLSANGTASWTGWTNLADSSRSLSD